VNHIKAIAAAAALIISPAAFAADYGPAPYYAPRPHYPAPRVQLPPLTIRQAPPVYWVVAPPQYVQELVPIEGCGGCVAGYASVGRWHHVPPPSRWDRFFGNSGY
jgi:hypothetical protein